VSARFQILSLDGGGLKGLLTASFLAQWEKNTGSRVVLTSTLSPERAPAESSQSPSGWVFLRSRVGWWVGP
jgi:hypothetical protein